jgi:hypothetical protein
MYITGGLQHNRKTQEIYSGRASGKYTGDKMNDAIRIMKKRDSPR